MGNVVEKQHSQAKRSPDKALNFRILFEGELFGLAFKEVSKIIKYYMARKEEVTSLSMFKLLGRRFILSM